MEKYRLRRYVDLKFLRNWKENVRRSVSNEEVYSIQCDTIDQIEHCACLLKQVDSTGRFHLDGTNYPLFIRWIDSSHSSAVMAFTGSSAAGIYRHFSELFSEIEETCSTMGISAPEDSVSIVSKRLEGHVITL